MKRPLLLAVASVIALSTFAQKKFDANLIDILPGKESASPSNLTVIDEKLYFFANDNQNKRRLFSVDKSEQVTQIGNYILGESYETYKSTFIPQKKIAKLNTSIYFISSDNSGNHNLYELKGNGAVSIAARLINQTSPYLASPSYLTPHEGKLYFSMRTQDSRFLYVFDPATRKVTQLTNTTNKIGHVSDIVAYKNRLYFTGGTTGNSGNIGLFTYDPILDLSWQVGWDSVKINAYPQYPSNLVVANNYLFYYTTTYNEKKLMRYDGTSSPTPIFVRPLNNSLSLHNRLVKNGDDIFFVASRDSFVVYNTQNNTAKIAKSPTAQYNNYFTVFNDNIFFTKNDYANQTLFEYDGQAQVINTTQVPLGHMDQMVVFNNSLYIAALSYANNEGRELYRLEEKSTTSVDQLKDVTNVSAFPNPTNSIAHLQFSLKQPQTLQITLTDVQGKVWYTSSKKEYSAQQHTVEIPMQDLPSGIYTYSITSDNSSTISKGKLIKL